MQKSQDILAWLYFGQFSLPEQALNNDEFTRLNQQQMAQWKAVREQIREELPKLLPEFDRMNDLEIDRQCLENYLNFSIGYRLGVQLTAAAYQGNHSQL